MRITGVMLLVLLILPFAAFAHGDLSTWQKLEISDPLLFVYWASLISGFFIAAAVYYRKHMGPYAKKITFAAIALPIIIATIYLSASTVYLNIASATGGPIHWHADYEIWACGEEHELVDPEGFDNRVGTPTVHEHNDKRMHIEGVLLDMEEASIHEYFEAIGGDFDNESLTFSTHEGLMTWKNGDLCNGQPAKLYVFVNGELVENGHEHVIAPYSTVPPGDVIKIVFSEKPVDTINTKLFEVP